MANDITRGQTQVLYRYLPGALFEHDLYGLCQVTGITVEAPDSEFNQTALFDSIADASSQWTHQLRGDYPDVRDVAGRSRFSVGVPKQVHFTPFPRTVECRKCGFVTTWNHLQNQNNPATCPQCKGRMRQLRYVEAHNCGRIIELKLPETCTKCKKNAPRLFDPGRTPMARWVCTNCRQEIRKLRMTPCNCAYSDMVKAETGNQKDPRAYMRVYPTGEPGLFIPQVLTFVNFTQSQEQHLRQVPDGEALMLARAWGLLDEPVLEVNRQRNQFAQSGGDHADVIEALRGFDPNNPLVVKWDQAKKNPPGQTAIDAVLKHAGATTLDLTPRRKLIEHVALKDSTRMSTLEMVVQRHQKHDPQLAARFQHETSSALKNLGINRIDILDDFPIAQTAFAYTRVTRDPSKSVLTAFPIDDNAKIPIYVLPTRTEGLWFQLDPVSVATWLVKNELVQGPAPSTPAEAWGWLHQIALAERYEPGVDLSRPALAIQTLVHSVSHVMLRRIEWSGFAAASVGEYLLPETLSFVLYANRYTESKIGGLTTLYEQRLPEWLLEATQDGRSCVYDPICDQDGGSCVGCLYREYNCPHFNHYLSRAVLFRGSFNAHKHPNAGDFQIKHGYWDDWHAETDK